MSPAASTDPVKEQNPLRSQNGISKDKKDTWCLLPDKGRVTTVIIPPTMQVPHPALSPSTPPSPHINGLHLPVTDTMSSQVTDSLLTKPDGQKGDEGLGEGKRQGEGEGGGGGKDMIVSPEVPRRVRDLAAYWLLGFCNNFTYWVMITAAYDLLSVQDQEYGERASPAALPGQALNASMEITVRHPGWSNESANTFTCQGQSTGTILVADTMPATALTLAAPFTLLLGVRMRVWLLTLFCIASYLVLGLASPSFVFLGVALASASRGFSDTTFLGYSSNYHKHVLSLWSSGTGVATFVGPLLFSAMTTAGLHPRHALLTFLAVPLLILISFWCVLSHSLPVRGTTLPDTVDSAALVSKEEIEGKKQKKAAVFKEKLWLWARAQKYLMPMGVFYLIMYFTNQGLLELVYFPASKLSHAQQYSWSNTVRCFGTLLSRSSHKLLRLPSTWLYSIFALAVMVVVAAELHFHFLPSEYILFAFLLVQGLAEGAVFTTTMFNLHKKSSEDERELCLSIFPTYLFLPAILAGLMAIPVHDILCRHHLYQ